MISLMLMMNDGRHLHFAPVAIADVHAVSDAFLTRSFVRFTSAAVIYSFNPDQITAIRATFLLRPFGAAHADEQARTQAGVETARAPGPPLDPPGSPAPLRRIHAPG